MSELRTLRTTARAKFINTKIFIISTMRLNFNELINTSNNKLIIYSRNKRNLEINLNLYLDNNFLRCLYYTLGDGSFIKGVYLSNINYRLHADFIKNFDTFFDIHKSEWDFSLTFNENFTEKQKQEAINFWKEKLKIKEIKRIYSTKFNTNKVGGFKTIYDNKELSKLLLNLLDSLKDKIYTNKLTKEQLCVILDGILNAEGSANIDKEKKGLHKITISFNKHDLKEKELFSKVLEKLDLLKYSRVGQDRMFIFSKWINHYKFMRIFVENEVIPFSLHPKRLERLLKGFLNHQRTTSVYKYIKILSIKKKQNLKEMNNFLKHDKSSLEEAFLRKFNDFGFFIVEGKGIRGKPYTFTINDEGMLFLKTIKKCKLWLKTIKEENESITI